ncbi:hypothetical protein [Rhizobium sp. MHM7A]|uniref:hypothetical protein n=1 Tax=Rhizobium sp. MHM7A TaxID=2583233 RepID=UPI0014865A75|nr:hypothetical protein [Rhizobium sp. MHM7A]
MSVFDNRRECGHPMATFMRKCKRIAAADAETKLSWGDSLPGVDLARKPIK